MWRYYALMFAAGISFFVGGAQIIATLFWVVTAIDNLWISPIVWGVALVASPFCLHLPLIVGAFFGATEVFGWHWFLAALFAASGFFTIAPVYTVVFLKLGLR